MAAPVPGIMDTTLHCDIRNSHSWFERKNVA
jgi:hypothetical protein